MIVEQILEKHDDKNSEDNIALPVIFLQECVKQ